MSYVYPGEFQKFIYLVWYSAVSCMYECIKDLPYQSEFELVLYLCCLMSSSVKGWRTIDLLIIVTSCQIFCINAHFKLLHLLYIILYDRIYRKFRIELSSSQNGYDCIRWFNSILWRGRGQGRDRRPWRRQCAFIHNLRSTVRDTIC